MPQSPLGRWMVAAGGAVIAMAAASLTGRIRQGPARSAAGRCDHRACVRACVCVQRGGNAMCMHSRAGAAGETEDGRHTTTSAQTLPSPPNHADAPCTTERKSSRGRRREPCLAPVHLLRLAGPQPTTLGGAGVLATRLWLGVSEAKQHAEVIGGRPLAAVHDAGARCFATFVAAPPIRRAIPPLTPLPRPSRLPRMPRDSSARCCASAAPLASPGWAPPCLSLASISARCWVGADEGLPC